MKKLKFNWLESNIWKVWLYIFTNRRAYITLLWIYFLTFPDNTLNQIGLYTALGSLFSFVMEIPSGYFSDRFWYKKTLILAKIFMFLATLCFIIWNDVIFFSIGSIFLSLWFSFTSWTMAAFFHENLEEMWKENLFTKILWRIEWSVSLFNALLIIAIPFLTKISFERPFYVWLWIDLIWITVALSLVEPKKEKNLQKPKNIVQVIKESKWTSFWPIVIFLAILFWVIGGTNPFRYPYIESIWYPVAYIGFVMWISRVIWFFISRVIHKIEEKISIKKLFFMEIFIFSWMMFLIGILKNPYIIWWLFALMTWYYWWRDSMIQKHIIDILPNKKYKATMLSIRKQLSDFISLVLVFSVWYIMNVSYQSWFLSLAIVLFVSLMISYIFVKRIK